MKYPTSDLIFLRIQRKCVYKEKSSHEWDISQYTTRKHYITIISHATLTHLSFLHRFRFLFFLFFDKLFNFFVRLTLFDFVFLFDLWLQEFQIKAKTRVFVFHFLIVYTKIRFACQDGTAASLSAGKFGDPKNAGIFSWMRPVAYRRICNSFLALWLAVFSMAWDKVHYSIVHLVEHIIGYLPKVKTFQIIVTQQKPMGSGGVGINPPPPSLVLRSVAGMS